MRILPDLARALDGGFQPIRETHLLKFLNNRRALFFVERFLVIRRFFLGGFRVDQRLIDDDGGDFRGEYATIGEELPHANRHVGAPEHPGQRLDRDAIDRLLRGRADLRIGVVKQQHENRQLLDGPRRQRAGGRQQFDVARDFAALEEIEKRSRRAHRVIR